MSPLQQKPILHGRDHCPGGADPIPCMLTATGSYQEQVLAEPSLIGYWPLDDASEPALDYSVSDRDLTEASPHSPTYGVAGPFDDDPAATAVYFNRNSGFTVDTDELRDSNGGASPYEFPDIDPYTFELLFYPTAVEAGFEGGIMGLWQYPGGDEGGIYLSILDTQEIRARRAGIEFDSGTALTLGEWVHLAMTYDGATLRLYFDGEEQFAEAEATNHDASGTLILGVLRDLTGSSLNQTLHGRLAQVAIYNEALSATTIAWHAATRNNGGGGGGGLYPGNYPIVNADVAPAADIAPTKIEHPGGTSSFLRADGTWAAPPGGSGDVATDTIWNAKGDLAVGTASDTAARLGVGTDDYVLTADSGETTGIKWAPAASGGMVAVLDDGSLVGTRSGINFHEGSNVTLTIADDAGNDEVDVTIAATSGGTAVDIQEFTGSGTWTDPGGITVIEVICIGGGGQGGGGASAVNTSKSGGGGGGGGAVAKATFRAADLAGTVAVTIGAGGTGAGGGGAAGAGASGTAGADGGLTSFGTHLKAGGGGGGPGGSGANPMGGAGGGLITSAAGTTQGLPAAAASPAVGIGGQSVAPAGGAAGNASEWGGASGGGGAAGGQGRGGGSSSYGGPGGGAGGGVSAANVGFAGGGAGTCPSQTAGTQGGGGAINGNGAPGAFTGPYSGTGGTGGGGGSAANPGGTGGAGFRGSGGGGGGAGSNSAGSSNAGGTGGAGGGGFVRVISY